ncbi:hypothetical protein [Luteolibacter soli]|uniref:Uncharacterized protein n=1 Tax=Luteolibacter soli TaxID=3135280 RepID=A0ABU9AXL3_9BACT
MKSPNPILLPLLVLNLIVSSAALYLAVTRHSANLATPPAAIPQSISGLARVPVDGLSLRFRHPELFESAHDMPRPAALGELVRRGALRPGISDREAAFLLGDVEDMAVEEADDQGFTWNYGLPGGNLVLEFSPQRTLLRALHTHDGGPGYAHSESLF